VTFDLLDNSLERDFFNLIPAAFRLSHGTVNKLREVAGLLIRQLPDIRQLMRDLATDK
jgi:hypothetical protein